MLIDFDAVDEWAPALDVAVAPLVSEEARAAVRDGAPEFVQDATDLLFAHASKEDIVDATIAWVEANWVRGYHGSRLSEAEVEDIGRVGLKLLKAGDRFVRLERALSAHPGWGSVRGRLAEEVDRHGRGGLRGLREGQIHLTALRAGLMRSFNHYLQYGSEFDQRVAVELLGEEALPYLALDGRAAVVTVSMPGSAALRACHWTASMASLRARGDLPNFIGDLSTPGRIESRFPNFRQASLVWIQGLFFKKCCQRIGRSVLRPICRTFLRTK